MLTVLTNRKMTSKRKLTNDEKSPPEIDGKVKDGLPLTSVKGSMVGMPEKSLSELCQEGLLDDIKACPHKQDGEKLNELDENGWSVMHHACRFNQRSIIEYLIEIGFDVNVTAYDDTTPLHLAVRHNCHEAARCLLKNAASPTMKNSNEESAVILLGQRGDKEMTAILLDHHETDLGDVDKSHRTALHHASFYGNMVTCEALLNRGADIEAKSKSGETALMYAVCNGKEDIVKFLIKRAKEKHLPIKEFVNVSVINRTRPLHFSARGGQFNIMEVLLRHGAEVDAQRDLSGRCFTALHIAAVSGDLKMCKLLLSNNATIDIKDCDGCTPLHRAAAANQEAVVTFLLTKGSALTSADNKGLTSYLHAVQEGHTTVAEAILKRNSSQIYQRTNKLRCSVHLAVTSRHKPMLMMLLKNGGAMYTNAIDSNGRTPLHYAAALGDAELIRILISYGSNPDMCDSHHQTSLHLACQTGSLQCVKLLMDKSVITLNFIDDDGKSALHMACETGSMPVASYLLRLGADVSFSDRNSDTALHFAVRANSLAVCRALLDYYAPCDVQNGNLDTPLHEAAKGDCPLLVVLFLDKKAKTELKNKSDKTFLDLAIENCQGEILEAIMNHPSIIKYLEVSTKIEAITKMVHTHPNVAIALLDECITTSPHEPDDKDFSIIYDFTLLDPGPSAGLQRFDTMKSLVENRQEQILSHALVKKLLDWKWTTFGRSIYLVGFLLFLIYHSIISWLVISERQNDLRNTTTQTQISASPLANRNMVFVSVLFAWAIINTAKEVIQMFLRGPRYFADYDNFVEIFYYVSIIVFFTQYLHELKDERSGLEHRSTLWETSIVVIFFGWFNCVLYLRNYMFPMLGLYITMFFEILKTFLRIVSVIFLFLFGFANVFYIMFPTQETFSNLGISFVSTTVMMIGEIGYRETLLDAPQDLPFPALSFIIFELFVCTMSILLANLLVGLAVGDIDAVQCNASMSLTEMLVDYVTTIEEKMPGFMQRRYYMPILTEKPNTEPSRRTKILNRLLGKNTQRDSSGSKRQQAVEEVLKKRFKKGRIEESERISRLEKKLTEQQRSVKQLKKLIQGQTRILQEMSESLGLRNGAGNGGMIMDGYSTLYGYQSTYS